MVQAINIAANGLIQSEQRATRLAQDIVTNLARSSNSVSDLSLPNSPTLDPVAPSSGPGQIDPATNPVNAPASGAPTTLAGGSGFSDIIQQLADLRIEENTFRANATAFSRINETFGSLLDEDS
ncbi:hypothetical protein [Kordiimonas sp. SCSIO 12610]|uniref:hypothetical protein n=1 Tax=Kordiimonas sp. SCSIO 12610 TaxID=2829597 RepID=UPI00210A6CE1|nr:hypothetical protein [Kordiimonas sp. SCSIO 12610]UTW56596.1 hypothetical protein KFF44_06780 [Kordiimonas sp. SCSIO 12610]